MRLQLFPLFLLCVAAAPPLTIAQTPPTEATLYRAHGLDGQWDPSGTNRIAYSAKGPDGWYDVHLALPDGSQDTCLTCAYPGLPTKHVATPCWHPNGQWLLVAVEKQEHPGNSFPALPGFGAFTDIWLISVNGHKAYKLVEPPLDKHHGIIMPRFSPDGTKIEWTAREKKPNILSLKRTFGYWAITLANLHFTGPDSVPELRNMRALRPEGASFYEGYGFSPDGSRILLCTSAGQRSVWDQRIATMDTTGTDLQRLTEKDYNEHAFYTPDGRHIAWMTNTGNKHGTDWWMMDSNGNNKHRLTAFNDKSSPQYAGEKVWCGMGSFNPAGDAFVGGRQVSLVSQEGQIMMVRVR